MKKFVSALIISVVAFNSLALPSTAFAQIVDPNTKNQACQGINNTADCGDPSFFMRFVTTVTNILTIIIGGAAVIMLVVGGIRYVVSGGDPQSTKGAKDTILYAIIGLVVAASAQLIVRFVIGRL